MDEHAVSLGCEAARLPSVHGESWIGLRWFFVFFPPHTYEGVWYFKESKHKLLLVSLCARHRKSSLVVCARATPHRPSVYEAPGSDRFCCIFFHLSSLPGRPSCFQFLTRSLRSVSTMPLLKRRIFQQGKVESSSLKSLVE